MVLYVLEATRTVVRGVRYPRSAYAKADSEATRTVVRGVSYSVERQKLSFVKQPAHQCVV